RYSYRVSNKQIIKPTDVAALQIATDKPLATLVTCTPIGTDLNRLIVTGEQIAPDPSLATKPASANGSTANINMPGIQPTVVDKILNAF
ncbi:MAG TPA: sortase, partial [Candidatus Acidoferrum sp.]|nr:sortase [Candidatus Acidoferrum sp.]